MGGAWFPQNTSDGQNVQSVFHQTRECCFLDALLELFPSAHKPSGAGVTIRLLVTSLSVIIIVVVVVVPMTL